MNIKFLLIAFSLLLLVGGKTSFTQQRILFESPEGMGYKDARGRVVISSRFRLAGDFSKEGLANVVDAKGWAVINRTGRVVIRTAFIFDGGPDYFAEGLARFTAGDKFGFYNERGKVIVAPRFDFASTFREGLAAVCLKCRKSQEDAEGHYSIVGGRWCYINRRGVIVVPLRFEEAENFEQGAANVQSNGKSSRIDKRGRILKP